MTNPTPRPTLPILLVGLLALAVSMGIGRFAFTPLMPLMMRDGLITAATGAELAAANYIGYLLGALSAKPLAQRPLRLLRAGLLGVALTTLASALPAPPALGWLAGWAIRGGAGFFGAWTLVAASSWCLRELALRGGGGRAGLIYLGVGLGIATTGLLTWLGGLQPSHWLWLELGVLAALGSGTALLLLRGERDAATPTAATVSAAAPAGGGVGVGVGAGGGDGAKRHRAVIWAYGASGLGYIIPATFLPAMARQQIDDPRVFGLAWPLFGATAALAVWLAARFFSDTPRQRVWAWAQLQMLLGAALPLASRAPAALALAAMLVGGSFINTTMAGLQLARELEPAAPTALLARMTIAFAVGQIAGPLLVRLAGPLLPPGVDAIDLGSTLAVLALAASCVWLFSRDARTRG
jgi:hypothetical protein